MDVVAGERNCGEKSLRGMLPGRPWHVIAKALPDDDVIAEREDEVAVVHLTWTQKPERPPWPLTTFMASADEFESHVASEYDWEP